MCGRVTSGPPSLFSVSPPSIETASTRMTTPFG
jgi:hypothetical protein